MSETHNFIYWNCLYDAKTAPMDYARKLLDVYKPRALVMDEVQPVYAEVFDRMAQEYGMIGSYDRAIRWKDTWFGTYALFNSDTTVGIKQEPLAQAIGQVEKRRFRNEYDHRSYTTAIIDMSGVEVGWVWARVSHPQHLLSNPRRNMRRVAEWATIRSALKAHVDEGREVVYMGDTNTTLGSTVGARLTEDQNKLALLAHEAEGGTRTWGWLTTGKLLYLDRAAASPGIFPYSTLTTLADTIQQVQHTSDHAAIMVSVRL